ncbi:unnamed protein product [Aphanomyces euteiches]
MAQSEVQAIAAAEEARLKKQAEDTRADIDEIGRRMAEDARARQEAVDRRREQDEDGRSTATATALTQLSGQATSQTTTPAPSASRQGSPQHSSQSKRAKHNSPCPNQAQDDLEEEIRQARQELDQIRTDYVAQRRLISELQGNIDESAKQLAKEKSKNKKRQKRIADLEGLCGNQQDKLTRLDQEFRKAANRVGVLESLRPVIDGHTQALRDLQAQGNQASAGGAGGAAGSVPPAPRQSTQADMDTRLDARLNALQDQMNKRFEEQAAQFKKAIDEVAAEAYTLASTSNQDEAVVEASMGLLQGIFQQLAARASTPATNQSDPSQRLCLSRQTHTHAPCQNAYATCKFRLSGVHTDADLQIKWIVHVVTQRPTVGIHVEMHHTSARLPTTCLGAFISITVASGLQHSKSRSRWMILNVVLERRL